MKAQSALALWPPAASATAVETDHIILGFTVLTLLLTVPVFLAITYFALRYRQGEQADRSTDERRSFLIEISWMLIPYVLTLFFFGWGAKLFIASRHPPPDAMVVEAVGRQWMWKFQHPTGQSEINDLHLPVDQPVRIRITSQDVIHALYLPALRLQIAALPDRTTEIWFKADRTGTYRLYCSEYCGTDHSVMDGNLTLMTQAEYQEWLTHGGAQQSNLAAGRVIYEAYGCAGCHDGAVAGVKAPSLVGLYGRPVHLADGRTLTADADYIRAKILNPNENRLAGDGEGEGGGQGGGKGSGKGGYKQVMPSFRGVIPADDLDRLVGYLKAYDRVAEGAPR
ncbi:cytochrome B [Methylobacterium sp. Leaf125]|uniref:cytochrome c oxidase subunit II n=1 Tax=Methylobacterium sp. Leaf125 TaxID=1736265 RepID=UPI0006F2D32E|nr:cytochrome c oxidase subunit II [Methylobacterium sp. Leaf125]KQQ42367.1 cytochrome B [Methylobacterium sp. Leaf125]